MASDNGITTRAALKLAVVRPIRRLVSALTDACCRLEVRCHGSNPLLPLRRRLAQRCIRGEGIEIGGAHQPLPVPAAAHVRYVDRISEDELRASYADVAHLPFVHVDVIDDGETLATFPDASVDFLIANHMLEHCQNPLGALERWLQVLRPAGVLFLAVPDKRFTFDRDRPLTTFKHLLEDYRQGPAQSLADHYTEWARRVGEVEESQVAQRVAEWMLATPNIHFHTWDATSFNWFLCDCQRILDLPFTLEALQFNVEECVAVLRKP